MLVSCEETITDSQVNDVGSSSGFVASNGKVGNEIGSDAEKNNFSVTGGSISTSG
jgi:hypothetical protein